ncbi:hypothetical protein OAL09_08770 [Verrucomicrobia bacterium]|nr:hypothetical protein [Verrucomicrobiota bacterium]NCG27805.1 hypothetical protein [Verrucomicrobiales bacterium]|tara:strand:+ start:9686 stop:10684 length:999 start_codon:yes stop_codon:yes gene_type:complete
MAFSFKELFKKEDHEILHDVRKLSFHPVEEEQIPNNKDSKDTIRGGVDNLSPFELVEESSQAINREPIESNLNSCSENSVLYQDNKNDVAGLNFLDEPTPEPPFSWSHNPINKENSGVENPLLEQSIRKCEDQGIQNIPGTNDSSDFFLSESEIDKNFSFIKEESSEQSRGNEFWPLGEAESSKLKKTALRSLEDLPPSSRNVEEKSLMPFILDDSEINYADAIKQIEAMPGIKECALIYGNEEPLILSQLPCSSEYFTESFIAGIRSFRSKFDLIHENPLTISYKQDRLSFFDYNSLFVGVLHGPDQLESNVEQKIINLVTQISKTAELYR